MRVDQPSHIFIEPLARHHNRDTFNCGIEALDRYLRQQASQDARKYVAATFVLVGENRSQILGYYTLSATSVCLSDLPDSMTRKLPRYPLVPAILLGRLAIGREHRGKYYGELLLVDALRRCVSLDQLGWAAVIVDAKDESAMAFYEHFHFIRFSGSSSRLFLPRETILNCL